MEVVFNYYLNIFIAIFLMCMYEIDKNTNLHNSNIKNQRKNKSFRPENIKYHIFS